MTKNDKYWKPNLPKLDSVTFRSVPENGARLAMLQTGEAQFIYPMPPEMIKAVEHNANITVNNAPSIYERYVAMNVTKKPLWRSARAAGAELCHGQGRIRQGGVERLRGSV